MQYLETPESAAVISTEHNGMERFCLIAAYASKEDAQRALEHITVGAIDSNGNGNKQIQVLQ